MENQYIVFKLFNQFCILGLDKVIEVMPISTMIKTRAKEINVMVWRNHSIPILDPNAMISKVNKGQELTSKSKIIIIKPREDMREIGILVEAVIGLEKIEEDEIHEATIDDSRYIVGRVNRKTYQLKLLEINEFIKNNIIDKFNIIYGMKQEELDQGVKIIGKITSGKEEVVETMRLRAVNWMIRATKKNLDETFIIDMRKIYDLTLKL